MRLHASFTRFTASQCEVPTHVRVSLLSTVTRVKNSIGLIFGYEVDLGLELL